jgi:hypothetical protein
LPRKRELLFTTSAFLPITGVIICNRRDKAKRKQLEAVIQAKEERKKFMESI